MIDLRFVEREVVDYKITDMIGQPPMKLMKKIKILQWRQCDNPLEVINGLQDAIWTDWTDIRTEEEHLSNTDDRA